MKIILFLFGSILLFIGCKESDPLVGEWYLKYSFQYPNSFEFNDSESIKYLKFNNDGTAQSFNGDWCTYTSIGDSNFGTYNIEEKNIRTNCYGDEYELEFEFFEDANAIGITYPAIEPHSDTYHRR